MALPIGPALKGAKAFGRCMHAPDPELKEQKRREEEQRATDKAQEKSEKQRRKAEENRRKAHAKAAKNVAA